MIYLENILEFCSTIVWFTPNNLFNYYYFFLLISRVKKKSISKQYINDSFGTRLEEIMEIFNYSLVLWKRVSRLFSNPIM